MKKTLVLTIILALIISLVTVVSAATERQAEVTVPGTAEEGNTVKVTVDLKEKVRTGVVWVTYDDSKLEVKGMPSELDEIKGMNTRELGKDTAGKTGVYFAGAEPETTVSKLTFEFTVKGKAGEEAKVGVTGEKFYKTEEGEQVGVEIGFPGETKVAITAKATIPNEENNDNGSTQVEPENNGNGNPTVGAEGNSNENSNGNNEATVAPTRYPQTGVNVGVIAGVVVLAIIAGYVVTKKN